MAKNNIDMVFTGSSTDLARALTQLERKYDSLQARIKALANQSRSSTDSMAGGIGKWVGGLAQIAAGYVGIPALIGHVVEANREMIRQADEAALKYDDLFKKFRIQAELGKFEGEGARKTLEATAVRNAVPIEQAEGAARQLSSSGFRTGEVLHGGATDEFLKILAAANETGQSVDTKVLAESFASYLNSQKKDLSTENLKDVGRRVAAVFLPSNFAMADFAELAKEGAPLSQSLSTHEQIAAFAALRNVEPAGDAATDLRNVVTRMATTKAHGKKVEVLDRMGLKPEDIDMTGENFQTALDRLDAGLKKLKPEDRKVALVELFEERGQAGAGTLLANRDKIAEYMELQNDQSMFERNVKTSQSGKGAARQRLTTSTEIEMAQRDTDFEGKLAAAKLVQQKHKVSPASISMAEMRARLYRNLGASDDTALSRFMSGSSGAFDLTSAEAEKRFYEAQRIHEAATTGDEDLNILLEKIERGETLPKKRIKETTAPKPLKKKPPKPAPPPGGKTEETPAPRPLASRTPALGGGGSHRDDEPGSIELITSNVEPEEPKYSLYEGAMALTRKRVPVTPDVNLFSHTPGSLDDTLEYGELPRAAPGPVIRAAGDAGPRWTFPKAAAGPVVRHENEAPAKPLPRAAAGPVIRRQEPTVTGDELAPPLPKAAAGPVIRAATPPKSEDTPAGGTATARNTPDPALAKAVAVLEEIKRGIQEGNVDRRKGASRPLPTPRRNPTAEES